MWLFTRYGFYSIGCASKPNGSPDPQSVMIRARVAAHLENLQRRFSALADTEILTWPARDYHYRLVVPKRDWVGIVGELAEEQEWSNFKNEAEQYQGGTGSDYVEALHTVWRVMYKLQISGV